MQLCARAPVAFVGLEFLLLYIVFLNKVALPASEHRQTQKGIRDTRKGARRWTYFL